MLESLLGAGSLALVYLALVLGGVGFPFPEEVVLPTSGAMAQRGTWSVYGAGVVGLLGVLTADILLYVIGRRLGPAAYEHPKLKRYLTAERRARSERMFARFGAGAVFISRFVAGTRVPTFSAAGAYGMTFVKFLIVDGLAAMISVPLMIWLGFAFAAELPRILDQIKDAQHWLLGTGVIAVAAYFALRWHRGRVQAALADEQPLE